MHIYVTVLSLKRKRKLRVTSKVIYGSAGAKKGNGSIKRAAPTKMVNERDGSMPCTRRKALETSLCHIKVRGKCVFNSL